MRFALPVFFLLFSLTAAAQADFLWVDDQLLDDTEYISHVSESTDGFYWLGNLTGLVRFDGRQVKPVRIHDPDSPIKHNNRVSSRMFTDGRGKLWFTTGNAIHSYETATERIRTYQVMEEDPEMDAAGNYYGIFFHQPTGHFWLRAGRGIYAFSPETGESRLLGAPARGVSFSHHTDADGTVRVWGSAFISNGLETLTVTADGSTHDYRVLASPLQYIHTTPLAEDRLLAATDRGLQIVTISGNKVSARAASPGLPTGKCYNTAASGKTDHYWACFPDAGAFEVDLTTGRVTKSILSGGPEKLRTPEYLYRDRRQNLWITDQDKGLLIVPDEKNRFRKIPLDDDDPVNDIYRDDANQTWAITRDGALHRIAYPSRNVSNETPLLGDIQPIDGHFYFLTGYWYLSGFGSMQRRSVSESEWSGMTITPSISLGLAEVRGRPLRITEAKLSYFDFSPTRLREAAPPGSEDPVRNALLIYALTDTTCLVSTEDGRLLQYLAHQDSSVTIVREDSLRAGVYSCYRAKNGNVYLGTENGLYRYGQAGAVKVFNELGPFFNTSISSIGEDRAGNLWIGTSRGLLCYDALTEEVLRYGLEDGLPANQFAEANVVTLPDGSMYMVTNAGLITFRPEEVLADEPPVQTYLAEVWVNQLPLSTDSSLQDLSRLELPYSRNSVDFTLGLVGLRQSGLAGFSGRLVGLEEEATFVQAGQRISYPRLPAGEYRYEYVAINSHGKRFPSQSFAIVITPHFTQTPAFFWLLVTAIALVMGAVYVWLLRRERLRQQRLREDQEKIMAERERIASELHDDLGGDLASMVFIIDGHRYLKEQNVASELDVGRIGELANGAIRNMREMIWVLDNSQTTLTALGEQILATARDMAHAAELSFQAELDEELPDFRLSSIQKRNLLLIAKETMQNIRKHAHATAFHLRFTVGTSGGGQQLTLEITDNGRGMAAARRDEKTRNHGHGLTNLHKRAADIGATLTFSPALPAGTRMKLQLPLLPIQP